MPKLKFKLRRTLLRKLKDQVFLPKKLTFLPIVMEVHLYIGRHHQRRPRFCRYTPGKSYHLHDRFLKGKKYYYYVFVINDSVISHTTQNSQNKWTKILSLEMTIFGLNMMVKSGLEKIILKFHVPLQSCCCPVQKNLPRKAELAWLVSRYL